MHLKGKTINKSCGRCLGLPYSLRAQYGTDTKQNALHASDSHDTAARELAFFFPKYEIPWVPGTEPPIQRTLALIRPSVLQEHKGNSCKDRILAQLDNDAFINQS